jgi:hypothetical protein
VYLVWTRITRPQRAFLPPVFAGLWVVGAAVYYGSSHWHQHFGKAVWLSGVASILVVAPVPLAVTLIVERATSRLTSRIGLRTIVAGAVGVLVTLSIQQPLGLWVGRFVWYAGH